MSFHQFNSFTGRLKQSTHLQPFYPLSPKALPKTEPPPMMFDSIKTTAVRVQPSAKMGSFVDPKIKLLQKKYQADMSIPSYLLGGKKDKILFRFCAISTFVLFGINMYYLVTPKK